jgi:hypothetical protein
LPATVHRPLAGAASSSLRLRASSESSASHPPRTPFRAAEAPSLGFRPSSRHQPGWPTAGPIPQRSVLGVSHAHDVSVRRPERHRTSIPALALRVCFAPQPRSGFALQGTFRHSRTTLVVGPFPLGVSRLRATVGFPPAPPAPASPSGLLSVPECAVAATVVNRHDGASPLLGFPSSRFSLSTRRKRLHASIRS